MRLTPEIVSILDYAKGFGHTDLVRVSEADLVEHVESRRHNWLSPLRPHSVNAGRLVYMRMVPAGIGRPRSKSRAVMACFPAR